MKEEANQNKRGVSPISARSMAEGIGFSGLAWDTGESGTGSLLWLENHLERGVLVIRGNPDEPHHPLNSEYSVRAKVGNGGGDFHVSNGIVYFVEASSGRIFRESIKSGHAEAITPAFGKAAAPTISEDGRWLLYVHSYENRDSLAIVDSTGEFWPQKLTSGADFYMQPAWHPGGELVAWIEWNHPNMPWDGTYLKLGRLHWSTGNLPSLELVDTIVGDTEAAIFQPAFSPDGHFLAYVSDQTGWWQLYLYDLKTENHRQLTFASAEHGLPAWLQGMRTYAFTPGGEQIFFLRNQSGITSLWRIDLATGREKKISIGSEFTFLENIAVGGEEVALVASGPRKSQSVITIPVTKVITRRKPQTLRCSPVEDGYLLAFPLPRPVEWQSLDGEIVFGLFHVGLDRGDTPLKLSPLIVDVHGGPTGQAQVGFNREAQFFTRRGYAFLEVNYRGSSGYGRQYRNRLRYNWGITDVQDVVSGALALVAQKLVDRQRLVIMGGSAGGYTVLKTLIDYPGIFKAGICAYGISDLLSLAEDTHKFEKHYFDLLVGGLPEAAAIYRERSPIYQLERINVPMAIFHGKDDMVVPYQQSEIVSESLSQRGIPHIYHLYPGEGHGFRNPDTIEHFYRSIEEFLSR